MLAHDATAALGSIRAPTLIGDAELIVFEDCAHAPIYENVEDFNHWTLAFLRQHSGR